MEQTIYVRSDQNNCNHLWRWSTLTSLVISLPFSIWQNCCLQYCSSASYAKDSVVWVRSVQLIVSFHSESEISKLSILNFCWIESAVVVEIAAPGDHWCLHVTFAPRWPDNHMQGILDFMGSEHWAPFNFSYSKASYENEITPSHECHLSLFFVPLILIFFFWRIPHLHQQVMLIMSLSKMKLGNISYMYNVLTAVNDWLWQKNSSELQLICLV